MKRTWNRTEVVRLLRLDAEVVELFEEAHLVERRRRYSAADVERFRVARELFELGVNLPGIEVALQLRGQLLQEREELTAVIADLLQRLEERHG